MVPNGTAAKEALVGALATLPEGSAGAPEAYRRPPRLSR